MGEKERRGLEHLKAQFETDQAAVVDAYHALEELKAWSVDVAGRRLTRQDIQNFAEYLQRIDLGLHQSSVWMAQLRRMIPHVFRIAGEQTQQDP